MEAACACGFAVLLVAALLALELGPALVAPPPPPAPPLELLHAAAATQAVTITPASAARRGRRSLGSSSRIVHRPRFPSWLVYQSSEVAYGSAVKVRCQRVARRTWHET